MLCVGEETVMRARRPGDNVIEALIILTTAGSLAGLPSFATAQTRPEGKSPPTEAGESVAPLPDLQTTVAGEPLVYLNTPNPVISSSVLTIPPGGVSHWMTHPAPAYLYVLQGQLTVEFLDGERRVFQAGQAFLQARMKWHRGRNEGSRPVQFLAVFFGSEGVPTILHPPGDSAAK
jgi:quercetin dioxygenase-like cupin family protein